MLTKGLRLPAVLREEPQYRLLFGSQVLSILGDRVTSVALPFAVLATGGGVGDVVVSSLVSSAPSHVKDASRCEEASSGSDPTAYVG